MYRFLLLGWLFLLTGIRPAAAQPKIPFAEFARDQDSVFNQLYEKRDTAAYVRLLDCWLEKFRQLEPAEKITQEPWLWRAYYNLACTRALLGDGPRALDELDSARHHGFNDYYQLRQDSDLHSLRPLPRYQSLERSLRATGDYLYILQQSAAYSNQEKFKPAGDWPAFTYEAATTPGLQGLKTGFRLDSVAGQGNQVSRVLNLLHWVHELIPHDGNTENPAVKNALDLIMVCRREGRGLNCRGLATVFNECCLALGFASRLVTCLPKDSLHTDPDCHVINAVFIPELGKWIWADPTNDAYVMDEKGELLGIAEVRERLIRGEPLILNPGANWNHRFSRTKEEYLYHYMAKNLFRLQCPLASAYDLETPQAGKTIRYLELWPAGWERPLPATADQNNRQGTRYEFYSTPHPDLFWKKP